MRLSTRGQYGLRAMYEFALEYEKKTPVALGVVADRAHIPGNYLEQLARKLRAEGLLDSYRGPKGGYILTRDPDEITIGEILRAVEGDLAPTECAVDESVCARESACAAHNVWLKIYCSIASVVDHMTLGDMVHPKR